MRAKIIKLFLKISKIIFIVFLAAILLLNILGIFKKLILKEQIPLVFGYGTAVIITGSMEPAVNPGDLIIIQKQDSYEVGDIVVYRSSTPITHRITEITPNGYITKGDANNMDDGEIERDRIVGKVVKAIPNVGNVILFFQNPLGILVLIAGLLVAIELPRLLHNNRKKASKAIGN